MFHEDQLFYIIIIIVVVAVVIIIILLFLFHLIFIFAAISSTKKVTFWFHLFVIYQYHAKSLCVECLSKPGPDM